MSTRPSLELSSLADLIGVKITQPVRLVLPNPLRGGPPLHEVRAALHPYGRVRFSGTPARIFADVDPGPEGAPIIAFDTIARSDAAGLERAILSALAHVDEIVIGVDARSDDETRAVAAAYADVVHTFGAAEIGLSGEEFAENRMHFANARNLGRTRVASPWTLVIDTDEYLTAEADLREFVDRAVAGALGIPVVVMGFEQRDPQRLARTEYRWTSAAHNQLNFDVMDNRLVTGAQIHQDLSLRTEAEIRRRSTQRDAGIDELAGVASEGDLGAMFHVVKHRLGQTGVSNDDVAKMVEDFRLRCEPHSVLAEERAWLAMGVAARYYYASDAKRAEMWALRVLLDGPRVEAFCLLGDIAEDAGDLPRAGCWYECANVPHPTYRVGWPAITSLRVGRLAGIRRALEHPELVSQLDEQPGPEGQNTERDPDAEADVGG